MLNPLTRAVVPFQSVPALAVLLGLMLLLLPACNRGPRLIDIKGQATVDGQPADGVGLIFFDRSTKAFVATTKTQPDGSFTVMTNDRQGIPEGSYIVGATWPDPKFVAPPTTFGASPQDPPDLFNGRYFRDKSDVFLDITSSTTTAEIALKTK